VRVRVCFVCSGNICRSPTAEAVFASLAAEAGLDVEVDSAGTGGWHAGDDMDARSRAALETAGYAFARHCAKQFTPEEFATRDVVVALDQGHRDILWWLAAETEDAEAARRKIVLLRSYDPSATPGDLDVPDPYYGGRGGFSDVLAQVERGCRGLLEALSAGELTHR
jgi:low molecular weight protein-tyrosine phosphatase